MGRRSSNTQMFALRRPPPERIELAGADYQLVRVFKHDFMAATCLYELVDWASAEVGRSAVPRVVVKFARRQPFCGFPLAWAGQVLRRNEQRIYGALRGVRGVPRWLGCVGESGYAVEYIECRPLDNAPPPPPGFFDELRKLFDAIHACGVVYVDSNKRSNILVGDDGRPYLVDYQISIRPREGLPWPLRAIVQAAVNYMAAKDIYHLYKHKRKLCPDALTDEEERLSHPRGWLHMLHRGLATRYRTVRRWFLRRQLRKGALVSPTEAIEDHHQPEKESWRAEGGRRG